MNRVWLDLWPVWARGAFLLTVAVGGRLLYQGLPLADLLWGPVFVVIFLLECAFFRQWRFAWRLRRFYRSATARVVVYLAPDLTDRVAPARFLRQCEAELDALAERFRFRLPHRPIVVLFGNPGDIAPFWREGFGGFANPVLNTAVVSAGGYCEELVRHELAHLFAARLVRGAWPAPPLFNEGLATWLQGTVWGHSFDDLARPWLRNPQYGLTSLRGARFFYAGPHRWVCYALAGSFTAFLVRHHGWDRYRDFFPRAGSPWWRKHFGKCFGVPFEKAEAQWRNELPALEVLQRRFRPRFPG